MDATEVLKRDHHEVTKLFQRFHESRGGRGRGQLVDQICRELTVHGQIEEELFYPAVRETGDAELGDKVEESMREHQRMKQDIASIESQREQGAEGELEPSVSQLQQDVEHHVTEEEGKMFPRVAEVMDERERAELGRRLRARKRELAGEGRPAARRSATNARKRSAARGKRAKATTRRRKTASSSRTKVKRGRKSTGSARKRARGGRGR